MQPAVCEENSGVSVDGPGVDTTMLRGPKTQRQHSTVGGTLVSRCSMNKQEVAGPRKSVRCELPLSPADSWTTKKLEGNLFL